LFYQLEKLITLNKEIEKEISEYDDLSEAHRKKLRVFL
jgi:hypothetical protein